MDLVTLVERIPPTFLGIIIGSLFTIIGVILTNASNTRRLRLQHEHERELERRNQDLGLRRDVYMAAMEAISAGMVAVGRYSDFNLSPDELMQSYTDKSPAIGRVTIVGNDETIEAVANFNQELTGTFMRLAVKREQVSALWQRTAALEKEIERASQEQERLLALINEAGAGAHDQQRIEQLRQNYEAEARRIEALQAEQSEVDETFIALQMDLVQKCVSEVAALDRLLIPVISLMRSELELPFNEAFYAQILETGHKKWAEYLEAFQREHATAIESEPARGS
jgi:hypothetical protein